MCVCVCDLLSTSSHSTIPNDLSVPAIHRNQRWGLSHQVPQRAQNVLLEGKGNRDGARACRGGVRPSKYGFYQVGEEKPQPSIGKIHLQLKEITRGSRRKERNIPALVRGFSMLLQLKDKTQTHRSTICGPVQPARILPTRLWPRF